MWGIDGSGLTPGSRPDGRAPEIPEISVKIPEKPENSGKVRKKQVTYQIKALSKLVHVDTLKFPNSRKFQKQLQKNSRNNSREIQ